MNTRELTARTILSECLWGGNRSADADFVTDGRALFHRPSIGATPLDQRGALGMSDAGRATATWENAINAKRVLVEEFYVNTDAHWTDVVECYGEDGEKRVWSNFDAHRLAMVLAYGHAATVFALIEVPGVDGTPLPALLGMVETPSFTVEPVWILMGLSDAGGSP